MITALVVLAILLLVIALVVNSRPGDFSVSRSTLIAAEPATVFSHVNNLKAWDDWSPWAKLDPNAVTSFSGPDAGRGASFGWNGNRDVGVGRMTIVDSRPNERVALRLDFEKPMKATNEAVFTFAPEAGGTRVTWTMSGRNNFVGKAFNMVVDCDRMIGGMFEKGLASLKTLAEGRPA